MRERAPALPSASDPPASRPGFRSRPSERPGRIAAAPELNTYRGWRLWVEIDADEIIGYAMAPDGFVVRARGATHAAVESSLRELVDSDQETVTE